MSSTRIWMKLMGFHNFYTGKDSNYSLIGKDNCERFVYKRTHRHSTDTTCQWVDCGYILYDIPKMYHFSLSKRKIPTISCAYECS